MVPAHEAIRFASQRKNTKKLTTFTNNQKEQQNRPKRIHTLLKQQLVSQIGKLVSEINNGIQLSGKYGVPTDAKERGVGTTNCKQKKCGSDQTIGDRSDNSGQLSMLLIFYQLVQMECTKER